MRRDARAAHSTVVARHTHGAPEFPRQPARSVLDPRLPELAQAFARLEIAARARDDEAAARILDHLGTATPEGIWLLEQFGAAWLRRVSDRVAREP